MALRRDDRWRRRGARCRRRGALGWRCRWQQSVERFGNGRRSSSGRRGCSDGRGRSALCRRWRRFDPRRGTPRAWLLAIARSTALDWFRADGRRRKREERAGTAERRVSTNEAFEGFSPVLEAGLRELTAGEREVVALRVVLDLDGEETARLLKISPTAVSTRLHRALAKLEERMRHDDVA